MSEIVPDHVNQAPVIHHVTTKSKPKITRQEKPVYLLNNRPLPKWIESPTQIYPKETEDLDSLEHNINVDFADNSLQQNRCNSRSIPKVR